MSIDDLKETAAMAHLNMDEKALAGVFPVFEQMLGFFDSLRDAGEDKAAFPEALIPASAALPSGAFGNARMVNSGFYRSANSANIPAGGVPDTGLNERLLNNAGERDGRFLVIPNVL